jgi:hypothetical protein
MRIAIAFTVRLEVMRREFVLDHSSSVYRRRGKPRLYSAFSTGCYGVA